MTTYSLFMRAFWKEWHDAKFSFFTQVSKKFPDSPGWTLSCLPLAIPTKTERLFPMYMVWFSGRPSYHLPGNTPGKKTFLTQLQYCFLLKTWYRKNNKGKIMNKKWSWFGTSLLKMSSVYSARKKNGKYKSINQWSSGISIILFLVHSHTLKASTKPKQLRKQKNLLFLFLMQGLKQGKSPLISQRGGGGGGGGGRGGGVVY